MTTMFIEAGTLCHGCGEEMHSGTPIVVDCEMHGQHVYCGETCMKKAVATHRG